MGMWLFLFTELLLFGGMFLLYSVYRFDHADQFHLAAKELNTILGTFNTAILLTSSLTIALSIVAIQRDQKNLSVLLQILTIILALFFLINKYFEWSAKFHHGIYPGSEILLSKSSGEILFFGLYYVMTGLHGIHVVVGMFLIAVMTRQTKKGVITKDSYVRLENAGLYWHLVDIIWIFLFPLFYLIT
ncbi:MAG: cytochrome c oxidase subunit 3 family protein [Ignavibacteriota bacterium]|nr:MAG: cytochrome c oxidase subunit 3 family protein [Chlorobiota bacterium]MBE7478211.1 cytochrome c oxidase subunit 3 [Ignavibacteriales bacterium]MBL1121559.1 cytochrome c oxidase subunit 3 family protein [Ignavibacteriota bacterium]MCC7093589.1 cytochrome c oxidase subunit 3 [Ignavibacteriaceae bacterium]MCE7855231.1 cytochrome c oxidase subunit 3 family protein [Ignavibacteria bacterium CHB3]MEB2296108.1 cytochrome c oxidase subunit 3 [Ignavibacteria bacterium]